MERNGQMLSTEKKKQKNFKAKKKETNLVLEVEAFP